MLSEFDDVNMWAVALSVERQCHRHGKMVSFLYHINRRFPSRSPPVGNKLEFLLWLFTFFCGGFFFIGRSQDPCRPNPCEHKGVCLQILNSPNGYNCLCSGTNYFGDQCETRKFIFSYDLFTKKMNDTFCFVCVGCPRRSELESGQRMPLECIVI